MIYVFIYLFIYLFKISTQAIDPFTDCNFEQVKTLYNIIPIQACIVILESNNTPDRRLVLKANVVFHFNHESIISHI